jgi:hypothetical protein
MPIAAGLTQQADCFVELAFWYFFGTTNKKEPGIPAKSLISNDVLVGGAGFEPATPAV